MVAKMIGLVMSSMDSETTLTMYEGIKDRALEYNYSTFGNVIYPSYESTEAYNEGEFYMLETMDFRKYDGLIVALDTISDEGTKQRILENLKGYDRPVVAIDCQIDGAYVINTANYESAKAMVLHLIDAHGRSKINYISGPSNNEESRLRQKAYIDAMTERNLSWQGRIFEGTFFVEDGEKALKTFSGSDKARDFDAIVCGNDMQAISVMSELVKKGVRVPEDVAVTGFDDISDTVYITPGLTTITKDIYKVGQTAIDILKDVWAGKEISKYTHVKSELVLRESCGCLGKNEIPHVGQKDYLYNFKFKKFSNVIIRSFVEAGTEAKTFQDYLEIIKSFIRRINPGQFSLHIHEEFIGLFELEDYPVIAMDFPDGTSARLVNVLLYVAGNFMPLQHFDLKKQMDMDAEEIENMISNYPAVQFLNSPLHYMDKKIGFVSFGNSSFPTAPGGYFSWISSMNITMNNIYNKMMLAEIYRTDPMTGVYNRSAMEYYWEKFDEIAQKQKTSIGIIFADVNNLKHINDDFGHEVGDYAITTVAQALKKSENGRFKVIRYGGDEFIAFALAYDKEMIEEVKASIVSYLEEEKAKARKPYELTASVGYFIRQADSQMNMADSIEAADQAMYEEKQQYHNSDDLHS